LSDLVSPELLAMALSPVVCPLSSPLSCPGCPCEAHCGAWHCQVEVEGRNLLCAYLFPGLSGRMLPENSYQLASGRLHISLTRVVDGQNVMASEFSSKEELIQALLCSCFLPIYCGFIPPSYRGVRYVDGGFTGLQPVSSLEEPVITVSPFTGELDICPRDCPAIFFCFQIFNGSIQISIENLCRISYALFPPSTMVLNDIFSQGYQDTALFLYRNSK
uniref:PNPLA domain-containing protein n=1 Tax=Amazona collaria TaxID=241587 RepID=A0A8B9GLN5_9PSIT